MELRPATDTTLEHQVTLAYIEQLLPEWQETRFRRDRAGGNSAEANRTFSDVASAMDRLLEDLFKQTVIVVEG